MAKITFHDNMTALERIDYLLELGEKAEAYEVCLTEGIQHSTQDDDNAWILGDIARRVKKEYGKGKFEAWCKSVGKPVSTASGYRTMAHFWQNPERDELRAELQNVSMSHFQVACRLQNYAMAKEFLFECADKDYSVEQARVRVNEILGKPTPPKKLIDFAGKIVEIDPQQGTITLNSDHDGIIDLKAGVKYTVKIYEYIAEEEAMQPGANPEADAMQRELAVLDDDERRKHTPF